VLFSSGTTRPRFLVLSGIKGSAFTFRSLSKPNHLNNLKRIEMYNQLRLLLTIASHLISSSHKLHNVAMYTWTLTYLLFSSLVSLSFCQATPSNESSLPTLFGPNGPKTPICFTGGFPCGETCCIGDLIPSRRQFCARPGLCCLIGTQINANGICCAINQVNANGKCCNSTQVTSEGVCCTATGAVLTDGICCPAGETNCGGVCCGGLCELEPWLETRDVKVPPQVAKRELCEKDTAECGPVIPPIIPLPPRHFVCRPRFFPLSNATEN
jgi:hypothetical protein